MVVITWKAQNLVCLFIRFFRLEGMFKNQSFCNTRRLPSTIYKALIYEDYELSKYLKP